VTQLSVLHELFPSFFPLFLPFWLVTPPERLFFLQKPQTLFSRRPSLLITSLLPKSLNFLDFGPAQHPSSTFIERTPNLFFGLDTLTFKFCLVLPLLTGHKSSYSTFPAGYPLGNSLGSPRSVDMALSL